MEVPEAGARRPPARRRLALALGAVAAAVVGLEVWFQASEALRARRKPSVLEPDELCEERLVPGLKDGVFSAHGQLLPVSTNALGHRGPELAPVKPPGGLRIACLGGSTTFGFGATADDRTYPAVLEALLRAAAPGRSIEVLNAGVPKWSTRASLDHFVARLAPLGFDVVVLGEALNDLYAGWKPEYLARCALPPGEPLPPGPLDRLERASALARWVARSVEKRALARKWSTSSPEGLEAYRGTLRAAVRAFRAHGARPVLCTYPSVLPPTVEEAARVGFDAHFSLESMLKRCPFEYGALREGLIAYNDAIRAVAREEQVDLVDLDALVPDDPRLYMDPIHHDDDGQRAMAQAVADHLLRAGALTRPTDGGPTSPQ